MPARLIDAPFDRVSLTPAPGFFGVFWGVIASSQKVHFTR